MSKFKFPRNPGANPPNPFEDERGRNPFGDDVQVESTADAEESGKLNPYVAQEDSGIQPYRPDDYETFLPHRGRLIFWAGVIGFSLQIVGVVVAAVASYATGDARVGMVFGLPAQLIGLAVAVTAWTMGHHDSLAIESGAMQSDGAPSTRTGLRFGIVGTMLGAAQLLLYFGLLIYHRFFV